MNIRRAVIKGDFWDSFVYGNKLLIHDNDNNLLVFDINILDNKNPIDLKKINKESVICSIKFDEFITDFDIYKNHLYYCNSQGVFEIALNKESSSKKHNKLWDARVQCIRAGSFGRIAMSASDDGLFEYDIQAEDKPIRTNMQIDKKRNIYKITDNHSTSCRWSYENLWNDSLVGESSLFRYYLDKKNNKLVYIGEYKSKDLFADSNENDIIRVSEGSHKIVRLHKNALEILNYDRLHVKKIYYKTPNIRVPIDYFEDMSVYEFSYVEAKNRFVVCDIGTRLLIIDEKGKVIDISSKNDGIVDWRTFARSRVYKNQIHVIYNDRLEIFTL